MKRINFLTLASAAVLLAASCDNSAFTPESGEGSMTISFNSPTLTRAAMTGNEGKLSDVSMLIFDGGGALYKYHQFTSAEISSKSVSLDKVKAGGYSIYVVANGPELNSVTTLAQFKEKEIALSGYNDPEADFVMEGHTDVTVNSGETATPVIAISRYVARVAVNTITNGLPAAYGSLRVERVFLSNVVNTQNLAGNKAPGNTAANWYNKEGRADEATRNSAHIINGGTYQASAPALTFAGIGQTVDNGSYLSASKYLYAYPNTSSTAPAGFNATFAAQQSVLVIEASYGGKTYYYPVVLKNNLARNYSYEVSATITGAGSDDPNVPVSNGSINATITVQNWADGTTYTETF